MSESVMKEEAAAARAYLEQRASPAVRDHSSVENCGPHVAISPVMLRSSNSSSACLQRPLRLPRRRLRSLKRLLRRRARLVSRCTGLRARTLVRSAVAPTLPSPLPCYGPLTPANRQVS